MGLSFAAPLAGRDDWEQPESTNPYKFQSTRPLRGATLIKEQIKMPQPTKAIISNEQKSGIRKGSNRASTGKVGALLLSVYIV